MTAAELAKIARAEHPWEGVDGHLWLRDMYLMLHERGSDHGQIAYALSKPWKWADETEAWRAAHA